MADLIKMISDWFEVIINFITHSLESLAALVIALGNISTGLAESITFFPSFLAGIMLTCVAALILLRVIGR